MLFLPRCCWYHARLASELPKKLTPAPANVIFDVDANTSGRLGLPAAAAMPRMSCAGAQSATSGCTAYALSQ